MPDTMTISIRQLTAADLDTVLAIEKAVYPQPWSEDIFRDELVADYRTYLAADCDGEVLGYGGVMLVLPEAHVTTLVVDPAARGHRIGTRLMLHLTRAARGAGASSLTLEVRPSNRAAQAIYRRFGMAPVGVRKMYYHDEDALIMWVHDIGQTDYEMRLDEIEGTL